MIVFVVNPRRRLNIDIRKRCHNVPCSLKMSGQPATSTRVNGNVWRQLRGHPQKTWDVGLTLVSCWPTVYDVGPTVNQRWANVTCLLGRVRVYFAETNTRRERECDYWTNPRDLLYCSEKAKDSNCSLEEWTVTAFWFCINIYSIDTAPCCHGGVVVLYIVGTIC